MQAEKGSSPTSAPVRTRLHRASRDFSRWARGGSAKPSTPATPLLQRTLASAGRPQDAQSILEFLLVSVPLLALIFGILEIGLAFYESTNLDYAASEAARTVSVCANICDYLYNGTLYRDYNMLRTLNQVNIRLDMSWSSMSVSRLTIPAALLFLTWAGPGRIFMPTISITGSCMPSQNRPAVTPPMTPALIRWGHAAVVTP